MLSFRDWPPVPVGGGPERIREQGRRTRRAVSANVMMQRDGEEEQPRREV